MLGLRNLVVGLPDAVTIFTADTDNESTWSFGRFEQLQQAETTAPQLTAAEASIDAVLHCVYCAITCTLRRLV